MEYSARWKGAGAFGSYQEAIDSPDVDVVLIATPPASHLPLCLAALDAGKHVIVEKPPFPSVGDLDRARQAADAADRRLFVAENYFYKPLLIEIRRAIEERLIGEVKVIAINALKEQTTDDWRDRMEEATGGAMFEGGIHWVSFMANLGLTVSAVTGHHPSRTADPDRTMVAVFDYAEGAVGTLFYSWEIGSPTKGLRLSTIYGTEGAITFESNGLLLGIRGRARKLKIPRPRDLLGYAGMFEDFLGAIREGRPAAYDMDRARRDLELVEEIYRTSGQPLTGASDSDAG